MNKGTIKRIIGPVVDVDFGDQIPEIYSALEVMNGDKKIILEVEQNIGGGVVRTVAMDTTDGLARGQEVVNTGKPISVPVGKQTLGRIFNVLGELIDDGAPLLNKERGGGEVALRTALLRLSSVSVEDGEGGMRRALTALPSRQTPSMQSDAP